MTIVLGNICQAPESKIVKVGGVDTQVARFHVAEDRFRKNGEKYVQFYRINLWRGYMAKLLPYLTVGRPVMIVGDEYTTAYIDKNGVAQANLNITNPTQIRLPKGPTSMRTEPELTPEVAVEPAGEEFIQPPFDPAELPFE